MKVTSLNEKATYYEKLNSRRLVKTLPALARLDGHKFSKYTKSLLKPYDERLGHIMIEVTKHLVSHSNALIGYTQSDEITLLWHTEDFESQIYYDGRVDKMIGDLAIEASFKFNELIKEFIPEKADTPAKFDCRVWNVPHTYEAINSFRNRENSCSTNSISMAAQHYFSHNELMCKCSSEMQDMLFKEHNINWNDYPDHYKRGSYVQRRKVIKTYTQEQRDKMPDSDAMKHDPKYTYTRNVIKDLKMPPIGKVKNLEEVFFNAKNIIR